MLKLCEKLFIDLLELIESALEFNFDDIQMPLVLQVDISFAKLQFIFVPFHGISFLNPERVSLE